MPGLGDMHTHLAYSGTVHVQRHMLLLLAAGVTTVRNMDWVPNSAFRGDHQPFKGSKRLDGPGLLRLKARTASGELLGPRIYTSAPWYLDSTKSIDENVAACARNVSRDRALRRVRQRAHPRAQPGDRFRVCERRHGGGGETCGSGLHMIDVREPTKPVFAGCYTELKSYGLNGPGYVHDTQCVLYHGPDKAYQGHEVCVNSQGGVVTVADVTDKKNPKTISIFSYPNVGYAHQGWFTEDQRYFFLDDELDENPAGLVQFKQMVGAAAAQQPNPTDTLPQHTRTMVFDMGELGDPVVLTQYYASTYSTDHNLYINGHYMYQGNYGAGLRVVDVADPKQPKEAGYLTKVGEAWGTYPFLKKNVVAVSTSTGLYLARLLTP